MKATTQCNLLTKADRVNERIQNLANTYLNLDENQESVSRESFKEFLVSVRLIITTELNEKGVERQWKN